MPLAHSKLEDFVVVGINHWNAAVPVREKFSLDSEAKNGLLKDAGTYGITDILALSTCNRTELLGIVSEP